MKNLMTKQIDTLIKNAAYSGERVGLERGLVCITRGLYNESDLDTWYDPDTTPWGLLIAEQTRLEKIVSDATKQLEGLKQAKAVYTLSKETN